MKLRQTLQGLIEEPPRGIDRVPLALGERSLDLYPRSVVGIGGAVLFMGHGTPGRRLYVVSPIDDPLATRLEGTCLRWADADRDQVRRCPLSRANATTIREVLSWTRPQPLGLADSFGLGDRLGLAGPAHLQAMRGSGFEVVLAQQSIRELERTDRTPGEVMDAAFWAVLQEGWRSGFGADADHLKNPADVNRMAAAGFTMFTIDPGDHVVDAADVMAPPELESALAALPWVDLRTTADEALARWDDSRIGVGPDLVLEPSREEVRRAWVKYGAAIAHAAMMYHHIAATMGDRPFEVEVSVDETASVTTPFEHWLVASELERMGVRWVGLAPRFVGDFEKGIDYRGDLELFRDEYVKHLTIAESLGPYKISIHSGSDKFSVYRVIGELGRGRVHVKTAGTSYLEALRTVAARDPGLFREVLDFARSLYEHERRTYHVSARLERVPAGPAVTDGELADLLDDDDARQVLHVTFGRVLTERHRDGRTRFKNRILACLESNEEAHHENLVRHFERHVRAFGRA
ncbi:MAG TPA: tagaturonate epimerase family protein [Methylomirabilota bacterium]|nr:tagaturonate epimerase family protein [Methylomirabilota bacterium]